MGTPPLLPREAMRVFWEVVSAPPPDHTLLCASRRILAVGTGILCFLAPARAMQVTGYSSILNDRFSGGFPAAPVSNPDMTFVGAGRNWSGVGWDPANAQKGYGFISPSHYLVARHFGGSASVTTFDQSGTLRSGTQSAVENTNLGIVFFGETVGDLSLGTLTTPLPNLARYGVLDLNATSATNATSAYSGVPLFVYGRGANNTSSPRLATTPVSAVTVSGSNHSFTTPRTDLQLEVGDSGSPVFANWTNPNGEVEPALIGNHAAVNDTNNFHNFLGTHEVINSLNAFLADDGRALRVVGNAAYTWVGSSSTAIDRNVAWGFGGNPNATGATTDLYVRFDPATAANRAVSVNANHTLRGLFFKSSASGTDSFTFSGAATLTIGRGGLTSYDNNIQTFSANLKLGDHQFWDAGSFGLAVANLETNGRLLEIRAGGGSTISGTISGTGSLALESGFLTLSGSSTYTGPTWIHEGSLRVIGTLASSASVRLASLATLAGSGQVPQILGSGTVAPGSAQAILTAPSVNPSSGLDFAFEFTSATAPTFGSATASVNDLLHLTGTVPFTSNLTATNQVAIFLDVPELKAGEHFRGGFFLDASADFLPSVEGATFLVHLRDAAGPVAFGGQQYRVYAGPLEISLTTEAQTANFGVGDVGGRILQLGVRLPSTSYDAWAATAFPAETPEADRLADADPNADGVVNLLAYAYRLDPILTPPHELPQSFFVPAPGGAGGELVYQFRRNKLAADLTYVVQVSDSLGSWTDFTGSTLVINADPDGDGGAEVVEIRIPVTDNETKKFVRLQVVR